MKYLFVLMFLCHVECFRILTVFPTATRSHYLAVKPIILELLKRGHEVVSISPFEEESSANYTWIEVEVKSMFKAIPNLKKEIGQDYSFFGYMNYVWRSINTYMAYITKQPKLAEFMKNDTSQFDLIFAHDFFLPIFYAFAHKYKAPLVAMSTFGHAHYIQNYMGGQFDYTKPHEFSNLEYPLNFVDVIRNCIYVLYDIFGRKIRLYRYQNSFVSELFGIQSVDLEYLERNIVLVLINSHYTTSIPRANLPNIVEIGGAHIEQPKPLTKELQNILDGADEGAILFSLGSIIELESHQDAVVTALARLKQRVLIKLNTNSNVSAHTNIYTFPWLPQNDILAHPNIKLFINHGGGLSSQEAVSHGVPIVCIPFQANQHQVCRSSVRSGHALHIPKERIAIELYDTVQKILKDQTFKMNALEASRKFKDRPIAALQNAIFWIEYYSRHKRAPDQNNGNTYVFAQFFLIITLSTFFLLIKRRNVLSKKIQINNNLTTKPYECCTRTKALN